MGVARCHNADDLCFDLHCQCVKCELENCGTHLICPNKCKRWNYSLKETLNKPGEYISKMEKQLMDLPDLFITYLETQTNFLMLLDEFIDHFRCLLFKDNPYDKEFRESLYITIRALKDCKKEILK